MGQIRHRTEASSCGLVVHQPKVLPRKGGGEGAWERRLLLVLGRGLVMWESPRALRTTSLSPHFAAEENEGQRRGHASWLGTLG